MINIIKDSCVRELGHDLLVVVFEETKIPAVLVELLGEEVVDLVSYEFNKLTTITPLGKIPNKKVYFVGGGKKAELTSAKLRKLLANPFRAATETLLFAEKFNKELNFKQAIHLATETYYLATYSLPKFVEEAKEEKVFDLVIMTDETSADAIVADATINAMATNEARKYGNYPANLFFPQDFAKLVEEFAIAQNLEYEILDVDGLKAVGATTLLAVAQGSAQKPYMAYVKYNGAGDQAYTALVGKGICFDSGGYSLKPSNFMRGMKLDKCGAVNCFMAFKAIVEKALKVNAILVLPMTENMIGANAQRVDDIVVSMSGKTIEIDNTDAEGRLILCDAITYAQRKGAKKVIDMATLTGACVMALSEEYTGTFTNTQEFLNDLHQSAKAVDEKVWQLPMDEKFTQGIKSSKMADLVNCAPSREAGASTAAAFLQEFIEDGVEWIHLDIAGSGMLSKDAEYARTGASGAMVRTLINYFENHQK